MYLFSVWSTILQTDEVVVKLAIYLLKFSNSNSRNSKTMVRSCIAKISVSMFTVTERGKNHFDNLS